MSAWEDKPFTLETAQLFCAIVADVFRCDCPKVFDRPTRSERENFNVAAVDLRDPSEANWRRIIEVARVRITAAEDARGVNYRAEKSRLVMSREWGEAPPWFLREVENLLEQFWVEVIPVSDLQLAALHLKHLDSGRAGGLVAAARLGRLMARAEEDRG